MSQLSGAPVWVKSSRCDAGQCVEVSWQGERIAVRDNTQPDIHLSLDRASWRGLVQWLRHSQLDR
jgi:hypothetical protein